MKKVALIIGIVLVLVIGAFVFVWLRSTPAQNPDTSGTNNGGTTFPIASSSTSGGGTYASIQDFLSSSDVHEDPNNPGYYAVGYTPSEDENAPVPPFMISYIAATKYFNIAIEQEPIGEVRKQAETYLMNKLGATKEQMCNLNYSIAVPNYVNSQFSGVNLGFSFCEGAVKLPG